MFALYSSDRKITIFIFTITQFKSDLRNISPYIWVMLGCEVNG